MNRDGKQGGIGLGEICAFVGDGAQLKGDVSFTGAFRVDGLLEGEIVRGEVLIVGEQGHVKGQIEVGCLMVGGQVQGNITARERVELLEASRVTGLIRTPRLVIAKGAVLNGKCEMAGSGDNAPDGP